MSYITAEEVKAIRNALKVEFGKHFKFSVRKCAGGGKVNVNILSGNIDFSDKWEGLKEGDYRYGYVPVNHYHIDKHFPNDEHNKFLTKLEEIIICAPTSVTGEDFFDNSDIQSDYFSVSYYYSITIGSSDKPYILNK